VPSGESGTIQGVVTLEGTSEPIPEVQITVNGSGRDIFAELLGPNATPEQLRALAQSLIEASEQGMSVPSQLLLEAQSTVQGRPDRMAKPLTAVTDAEGRFRIENVPVGNAILRAQLKGYFSPLVQGSHQVVAERKAVVEARKTVDVRMHMVRGVTISGRVYSAAGKTMTDVSVQVLRPEYSRGQFSPQLADVKMTDDRGEFRSSRIPPGEYYVMVSPRRMASPGLSAPKEVPITTFYPDATQLVGAQRVAVRPGEELSNINIRVRSAPGAKISGRVTSSLPSGPVTGQRGQARPSVASIALMIRDSSGYSELNGGGVIVLNAPPAVTAKPDDGSFEIPNVPPGTYDIFARLPVAAYTGWGPGNPPERASVPWAIGRISVDVNGADVEGINLVIGPGVNLKGQLIVDGRPTGADVRISLQPDDNAANVNDGQMAQVYGQIAQFSTRINSDGSFVFPLLPEGPYRFHPTFAASSVEPVRATDVNAPVSVTRLPETAYVSDVRQGGVSVYDSGIVIGQGEPNPIEILVNTDGGSIEGTVLDREGTPAPGLLVVLVPMAAHRSNPEFYKSVASGASGSFSMSRIPPGQYTLFASANVQAGALQNAGVREKYFKYGTGVSVSRGALASITLRAIPND
jgi:hypothetical protein